MNSLPHVKTLRASLCLAALAAALSPAGAPARVGETRSSFEERLFSQNRGKAARYTSNVRDRSSNATTNARDRNDSTSARSDNMLARKLRSVQFRKFLEWLPENHEVAVYYKAMGDVHANTKTMVSQDYPPGWEIQVLYVGGTSVLEVYRRSQAMTELEFNGLMNLNRGGGSWREGTPLQLQPGQKVPEGEEEHLTAIGYDYERTDGAIRAKKTGNGIMFFLAEMDRAIFRNKDREAKALFPESLRGF